MIDTSPILCAGSALWDIIARTDRSMRPGHDVPGRISHELGGVALNVALALAARGVPVALLSAVGRDAPGDTLLAAAEARGISCNHVTRTDAPTDAYMAIEDVSGEVFGAIADCAALERSGAQVLSPLRDGRIATPAQPFDGTLVVDGNFPQALLDTLVLAPEYAAAQLALVPASPGKAERLARAMTHPGSTLYVNRIEAEILCTARFATAADAARALISRGAARVVVTDSHRDAAAADAADLVTYAPQRVVTAGSATGAGDAFLAAHLSARSAGVDSETALVRATEAAAAHIARGRAEPALRA